MANIRKYDEFKDSQIVAIAKIPAHWQIKRLKDIALMQNSNVDKKAHENETPVKLCNYVDVYKNEFIDHSIPFMQATANESEIRRFKIEKNDILVTKDSETADDIANPALVVDSIDNTLCGYHLAQIKPAKNLLFAPFLFRLFQSSAYNFRFAIHAKGITRVGLSVSSLRDALTPVPPLPEQKAIAAYLDEKTKEIDQKIALLQQKAERYADLKQALINETVTRGLEKTVEMKDSGIEWVGEIPAHWEVKRIKDLASNQSSLVQTGPFGAQLHASDYVDKGIPLILIRNVKNLQIDTSSIPQISEEKAASLSRYRLKVGDIVFSRVGSIGRIALIKKRERGWLISGQMLRLRIRNPLLHKQYLIYLFGTEIVSTYMKIKSAGSTRESINTEILANCLLLLPPYPEQKTIADYLDERTSQIGRIVENINTQIEKLTELRKTLINDVVTGQIKVV